MAAGDFVQSKPLASQTGDPSVTLGAGPTEGNLLVAIVNAQFGAGDTHAGQNGYAIDKQANTTGGSDEIILILSKIAGAGESTTQAPLAITPDRFCDMVVMEFTGPFASPHLDKTNAATGDGVLSIQPGTTGTLTQADEVAVTGAGPRLLTGGSEAIDSGFTVVELATLTRLVPGYLHTAATTALNPMISWTNSSGKVAAAIATYLVDASQPLALAANTITVTSGPLTLTPGPHPLVLEANVIAVTSGALSLTIQIPTIGAPVARRHASGRRRGRRR